jgi:hypothetical protein
VLPVPGRSYRIRTMRIYKEMAEVGEGIEKVKGMQDKVLDVYEPDNEKLNKLMKMLVELQRDMEALDKEYEELAKKL